MTAPGVDLQLLRTVNDTAGFNRWAAFEVIRAEAGLVELRVPWRAEFGQYAGFLHAGVITAMIDTACGFAAATVAGNVVASHCAVSYLAQAKGQAFLAHAHVVKAGRRQVFVRAELSAELNGSLTLVAAGETLLVPTGAPR